MRTKLKNVIKSFEIKLNLEHRTEMTKTKNKKNRNTKSQKTEKRKPSFTKGIGRKYSLL